MNNSRFWMGLAILMTPPMAVAVDSAARLLAPIPVVEGRVMYQGRPLRGGIISFASQDRERSRDMFGLIDYDGHFVCYPEWAAHQSGQARFEIRILPDPRESRSAPEQDDSVANRVEVSTATAELERHGDSTPTPTVTLASFGSPDGRSPEPFGRTGAGRRSGDVRPRPLQISIDCEVVHLDIDLTD